MDDTGVDSRIFAAVNPPTGVVAVQFKDELFYVLSWEFGQESVNSLSVINMDGEVIEKIEDKNVLKEKMLGFTWPSTPFESILRSCEINRAIINKQVESYFFVEDTWPMDSLSDIKTNVSYFPDGIPTCPIDQTSYSLVPSPMHRVMGHRKGMKTHRVPMPSEEVLNLFNDPEQTSISTILERCNCVATVTPHGNKYAAIFQQKNDTTPYLLIEFGQDGSLKKRVTQRSWIDKTSSTIRNELIEKSDSE